MDFDFSVWNHPWPLSRVNDKLVQYGFHCLSGFYGLFTAIWSTWSSIPLYLNFDGIASSTILFNTILYLKKYESSLKSLTSSFSRRFYVLTVMPVLTVLLGLVNLFSWLLTSFLVFLKHLQVVCSFIWLWSISSCTCRLLIIFLSLSHAS